jgi:azurin
MKNLIFVIVTASVFLFSCGGNTKGNNGGPAADNPQEVTAASIPGIDTVAVTDSIKLQADDFMHFNKDLFKVKKGVSIVLQLKNIGSQTGPPMSHNCVILNRDVDISAFADEARKFKDDDYIPPTLIPSIIAHTHQVAAGKTDQVVFAFKTAGVYNFICSYPGHWGTMQGQIVVE